MVKVSIALAWPVFLNLGSRFFRPTVTITRRQTNWLVTFAGHWPPIDIDLLQEPADLEQTLLFCSDRIVKTPGRLFLLAATRTSRMLYPSAEEDSALVLSEVGVVVSVPSSNSPSAASRLTCDWL